MRLLRRFPAVALLVVLLGIAAFFTAGRSVGMLLVSGVLAVLSWYVTEGPRGRALPAWVSNLLIVAVWLNFAVELFQQRLDILGALGQLIVWMSVIKLYQRKAPRDYAQLLTLSVLLVVLGAVRSTDLLFALVLVLYGAVALYALLLYQLYAACERTRKARSEEVPAGERIVASIQPVMGRRVAGHLRGLLVSIGAAGLVTSSVLFILFPRQSGRFAGEGGSRRSSTSGFADEVNLASSTRLSASRRVVMTVTVEGDTTPGQPIRMRGAVLDSYEGEGRWRASAKPRDWRSVTTSPAGPVALGPVARGLPAMTQRVELLVPGRVVYAAWAPVALWTPDTASFRLDDVQTIRFAGTGRLRGYSVQSVRQPDEPTMLALSPGRADPPDMAGLDPIRGRLGDLARGLLRRKGLATEAPSDAAQRDAFRGAAAQLFTDYLRSGVFTYTTDLRDVVIDPGEDPIEQFLFETRRGHCEYYASALAALCASVGVPARLVTGYLAIERDESAGNYVVRAANAHAWVEAQVGEHRWATFDPTPPGTLHELRLAGNSFTDRLRWIFDRFESAWHNEFVTFDRDSQSQILSRLDLDWAARGRDLVRAALQGMARLNRKFYFGPAGYIWMGIVALAGLMALVALLRHLRRRALVRAAVGLAAPRGAAQRRALDQLGFYLDMLTALRRAGRPKPAWQPPLACAESLASEGCAPAAATMRRITTRFYAARYGNRLLERRELAEMQELVRDLAGQLAR